MFNTGEEFKERSIYTGLCDVNIIAVNPTVAEAEKLQLPIKEELVYTSKSEEGNDKIRLDFWVKSDKVLTKVAFFLENAVQVSSQGNTRFINDLGQSTYAASKEELTYEWFSKTGLRGAMIGEAELIEFIKAWLSVPKDGIAKFDNISSIIKGDLTQIKDLIKSNSARKVQILLVVKESDSKYYQNVYTRYFGRAGSKTPTYWQKHMDKSSNPPEYQNSFKFQEFNPLSFEPSGTQDTGTANPWT